MASIAFVAVGTPVGVPSANTIDVDSPAGAIGDILIFLIIHDDYSQGAIVPNTPPITMNTIHDGSPQLGDDSRTALFWAEEDQAAARTFTFDWTTAAPGQGVVIRYSGQDTVTPIQAGSVLRRVGATQTPDDVDQFGAMNFYTLVGDDGNIVDDIVAPPSGFAERLVSGFGSAGVYIADEIHGSASYPYPHDPGDVGALYPTTGAGPFGSNGMYGITFVITNDSSDLTIAGVTRDNAGDPLGLVDVALMKSDGGSPPNYRMVDQVVSTITTGAYSFTVTEDTDAEFMCVGNLQGSPDTFDVTSSELAPS